jgi:8-oxo-dGTP pyrophosphatase MutT (NUDIX family)
MTEQHTVPVPARLSSTVMLVRGGDAGPEVLMVQRHERAAFGGAYAFPGGVLSEVDRESHSLINGLTSDEANQRFDLKHGGLDFYSAAARELFEETGILLAQDNQGRWASVDDAGRGNSLEQLRLRLSEGDLSWPELFSETGLILAADELHYIAHWEAPLHLRQIRERFSTRFFLAVLPDGQQPRIDQRELVDSCWLTPARALDKVHAGELRMIFPTVKSLEQLSKFSNLGALQNWARERWREGISMLRPIMIEEGGKTRFLIPGDRDYPENSA